MGSFGQFPYLKAKMTEGSRELHIYIFVYIYICIQIEVSCKLVFNYKPFTGGCRDRTSKAVD